MQRVMHEYKSCSRVFNMIEALYTYISDTDYMFEDVIWLDTAFKPLNDILNQYISVYKEPLIKDFNLPKITSTQNRPDEITVCLSGGKDSAAVAYYYKQLGYTVHLYHANGINKAYGDEIKAAKRIAKYLKCDLHIEKMYTVGTHRFIEHPLKNYIIANGAVHYCLQNGYTPRIAFGNFTGAKVEYSPFEICGGDCIEMWNAYRTIVQSVIPDFDIMIPLATNADTFAILESDWKLFERTISCMSPYRFRAHWKHRTEQNFNVRLFENRCGVCWKCCMESIWLMDTGRHDYNEAFYAHCIGILASTVFKETGRKETYDKIWYNYMFYPIEQSKAHDLLMECELKYRNNKSVWVLHKGERINAPIQTRKTITTN